MPISTLRLLALSLVFNLSSIHATILPPTSQAKAEVQDPMVNFTVPDCSNQNWSTLNRADLWNESYWWNPVLETHDLCEEPTDLCITVSNACSGGNVHIEYLLFLDLDQNGTLETVINSADTTLGWNKVLFNNANTPNFTGGLPQAFDKRAVPDADKFGFTLQEIANDTLKIACVRWNTQQQLSNYIIPELPHGTHKIKWIITDDCGTNLEYEYTFTVKDCKAPIVVCLPPVSVNIPPGSLIQLWVMDFLQYAEDNCSPSNLIKVGIRKCGTGTGFPVDAQGSPISSVTFTCNELGTQCVEIWAIDATGNADYCEAVVIIQDAFGNCGGPVWGGSGSIKTEGNDGIEGVLVRLFGSALGFPPFEDSDWTDEAGIYQIPANILSGASLTIAPEKGDNPLNGVTTFDLVLISKHILGSEPLNTPFKMIAADANKSGSITTFDMIEIRKLILGFFTEFPNNQAWRFMDKSFVFPNANNPFQTAFPETINLTNQTPNLFNTNFVGIKIGDVNNTAIPNLQMQAEERTNGTAMFDIEDQEVGPGETFEVQFKAAEALEGFQFTITLNGLKALETLHADGVDESNFNLQPEHAMAVSINGAQDFTVKFRAEKAGKLSEMLGVSGAITRAEAYGKEGRKNIAFRFDGKTIAGRGFELYQNQPNPFVNQTRIGFFLPEAAEATLSVFDETGRVVYQQKGQFPQGENSIPLDRALLNTTGVLYYQLATAREVGVRKMIQAN